MCEKDAHVTIKYRDGITGSNENDWSYQNLRKDPDYDATSFAGLTPYIPVYDNGVLLWVKNRLPAVMIPGLRRRRLQLSR